MKKRTYLQKFEDNEYLFFKNDNSKIYNPAILEEYQDELLVKKIVNSLNSSSKYEDILIHKNRNIHTEKKVEIKKCFFDKFNEYYNKKREMIEKCPVFRTRVFRMKMKVKVSLFMKCFKLLNSKPFTVKDITALYNKKCKNEKISLSTARRCLKNIIGARYKKVDLKPKNFFTTENKLRSLNYLRILHTHYEKNTTLWYYDESSMHTYKRKNKSWIQSNETRYKSYYIKLSPINILFAHSNNGEYFYQLTNTHTSSTTVINFFKSLASNFNIQAESNNLIILDNASYHTSIDFKRYILSSNWKLLYLPAYKPYLNSAEFSFNYIKQKLRKEIIEYQ